MKAAYILLPFLLFSACFAFPPGQPGDNTCTEDLDSMVEYCEDYCTRMTGGDGICVLCETSVSERGILDACMCQSPSTGKPLKFYNITCDIAADEHPLPAPNVTEEEPAAPRQNGTQDFVTAINKTNATSDANKSATISQPKPSEPKPQEDQKIETPACLVPVAMASLICLALSLRRRN